MSRRQLSSAGTVSLFPFLAVLICAMGALILLLLVTTRRIRQQTLAVEASVQQSIPQDASNEDSAPTPAPSAAETTPQLPEFVGQPILPMLAPDELPPPPVDPTPALLVELRLLEQRRADLQSEIAQGQSELTQLEESARERDQSIDELNATTLSIAEQKRLLNDLYVRLRQQEKETEDRANELRRRIQKASLQNREGDSRFAFVPYDGDSGTTRRPIVLECWSDRFVFASEGVTIRASDLNGFTPRYNPLLYVTQALIRYWDRRDRESTGQKIGKPYLLLVVRPQGTTGYYVARALLAGLQEPFGYELVTEDQQFQWPSGDLEATRICELLISKMLAERNELMDVALRGGANLSDFSSGRGEFRLEEVERLQNPTQEVTINGQRFRRDAREFSPAQSEFQSEQSGSSRIESTRIPQRIAAADDYGNDGPLGSQSHSSEALDSSGVHTRQHSAITRAERSQERSREGTESGSWPRPDVERLPGAAEINPFADPGDGSLATLDPSRHRSGAAADSVQQPPSGMMTFTPDRRREESSIDPERPQWGIRTSSGTIGFEREVAIRVESLQVTVGERTFQIDSSMSAVELRRLLASTVNSEVKSWGSPPRSFYWVPAIRFTVADGGRTHFERLQIITDGWKLRSSSTQESATAN